MKLSADPLDFSPPRGARWHGPLLLALGVHALLIAALTWGVSWQQDAPAAAVAAELWAALPAASAPRAIEPEAVVAPPEPEPEPVPAQKPVAPVKPAVTQAVEKPVSRMDAGPNEAQIALQRKQEEDKRRQQELERQRELELELKKKDELKKKEELRKKEEARQEAERRKREAEQKAAREREQARLEKARQEKLKQEQDRKAEEKKRSEQAAKDKAAKEKAEQLAREKTEKEKAAKEKAARDKAEAARIEAERKKQLARMMGQAGGSGDANGKGSGPGGSASGSAGGSGNGAGGGGAGSGAGGSGASAGYAAKVAARIKTFYNAPEPFPSHLTAEAEIRTLPDGTILSQRLLKSSGNPAFDETVLRAIDRAGRLPKDDNGRMPDTTFVIKFRP